jgi:hypothetical protein
MSVIDSAIGFFSSLVGMITLAIGVGGIGVIYYVYKYSDVLSKGTVILFRPKDRRAEFIPIEKEEAFILKCKEVGGIPRQYVKGGSSWLIKKKPYFLGMEASGYTGIISSPETKSIPMNEVLKTVWGDKVYNKIPQSRITQLLNSQWMLNLEPKEIDLDGTGLPRISSENLNSKEDAIMLKRLADAVEENKPQTDMMMLLLAVGCGAGAMLLMVAMKWVNF